MATAALHVPVMVREVVEALRAAEGGWFVDCTLGMGGHARAVLDRSPDVSVLGVDRDEEALGRAREALSSFGPRFRSLHGNFKDTAAWAAQLPEAPAGVLADLGVSLLQLKGGRGFSFRDGGSLDMRMDTSRGETAEAFLARATEAELRDVIRRFGEEPFAARIARAIVATREDSPIHDAATLADVVASAVPRRFHGDLHPATRTFQALRIAVNGELEGLDAFFRAAAAALKPGGRLVVLAYHSLEDRIAKEALRDMARGCVCPPKMPVCGCGRVPVLRLPSARAARPSAEEVARNPASRSARMRVGEKL